MEVSNNPSVSNSSFLHSGGAGQAATLGSTSAPVGGVVPSQGSKEVAAKDISKNVIDTAVLRDAQEVSDDAELNKLKEDLNKELNPLNIYAKFGFDDGAGSMFVSVYEKSSDQLIRKIPSDEVMRMMSKMKELMGAIIDKKA